MEAWLFTNISASWMQWTGIGTVFFSSIAIMLLGMTIAQLVYPTVERKGFLPIRTTRGDRLFIGLLSSAFIHLFWIGVASSVGPLWVATIIGFVWVVLLLAKG